MLLKEKDRKLLYRNKKKKNKLFQQNPLQKTYLQSKGLKVQLIQFIFLESTVMKKHQVHFLETLHQKTKSSIQFNN